jgi:hypothetical protein
MNHNAAGRQQGNQWFLNIQYWFEERNIYLPKADYGRRMA